VKYLLLALVLSTSGLLVAQPRPGDSPARPDSVLQLAAGLFYEGAYARVVDLLQPGGGTVRPPKANYYLGASFAALNDPESAIRYLRIAVDSANEEISFRFQLAKSLYTYGAAGEARDQYRAILSRDSAFIPALFNLGTLAFDRRDYVTASDMFGRAVRLNARDYLSYYNLAASLVNMGKPDSALQFLLASIALNRRSIPSLSLLASLYYKRKEYQDAERLYGMIIARDSGNADVWARRGYCMEKLKDPKGAVECFRNASIIDTTNATYLARLGQAWFELKVFDSAAISYIRAADLEEENPVLYLNAGLSYASIDSLAQALAAFHRSYESSHIERLGMLYSQMAGIYYKQKKFRPAERAYLKALEFEPGNKQAVFFLAHAREELRDYRGAASSYARFIKVAAREPAQANLVAYARKRLRALSGSK
jgi:tetratricopeptide (TPR) repeat protein